MKHFSVILAALAVFFAAPAVASASSGCLTPYVTNPHEPGATTHVWCTFGSTLHQGSAEGFFVDAVTYYNLFGSYYAMSARQNGEFWMQIPASQGALWNGTIYTSGGTGTSRPNVVDARIDVIDLAKRKYIRYRAKICGSDTSPRFCDQSENGFPQIVGGPWGF